jgi:hypothetical protein
MRTRKTNASRNTIGMNPEAGLSLIELLMAGAFLAVAACGMSAVLAGSLGMTAVNKETALARNAAQRMLEELQNVPPGDVFTTFNHIIDDDPLGDGTAPGGLFSVKTKPAPVSVSSMFGEIIFPEPNKSGELREDMKDEALGMPRDLNGDGEIDNLDHSRDYIVLPVRIRISWRGLAGERTFELHTVLLNE